MGTAVLVILAIIGGIALAIQSSFMGIMDQRIGSKESVFFTFAVGGALSALMMIVARGGHLNAWQNAPRYAFTAGALGLPIVAIVGYAVTRLGLSTALTVMVASQIVGAMVIDHFGLFGATVRTIDLLRTTGVLFLILGVWLVLR